MRSLSDHDGFLTGKVGFPRGATLGVVDVARNGMVKVFTVAAVAFMPPTLFASIYGMNFQHKRSTAGRPANRWSCF